jgi:GTP-binding protein Era
MSDGKTPAFHCGYAALVGRPNVGKSTLLNRLVGQKISITTPRAQTTRHRILGIKTVTDAQILYVDTPGFHPGYKHALNRYMNQVVTNAVEDVDVVVFVVSDVTWKTEDRQLLDKIASHPRLLLAVNKVDTLRDKSRLLPHLQSLAEKVPFRHIIPLSAKTGDNVERLPVAPPFYGDDQVTDRSLRFLAAELIREALMRHLGDELPYQITVAIESFVEQPELTRIAAVIWVDQERYKPMVIGKGGAMLKKIGSDARRGIEDLVGTRVFLELLVKVKEDWTDDESSLRRFGYE